MILVMIEDYFIALVTIAVLSTFTLPGTRKRKIAEWPLMKQFLFSEGDGGKKEVVARLCFCLG